jgi:beta-barrel assembly-enhancing protease
MARRGTVMYTALLIAVACDVAEDQEASLGAQAASEIEAEVPLVEDPVINEYVSSLGQSIAARTARSDLDWHFRVVDSPQVNAFALPGGYIYLNRGLIEATRSLSELAGVLGHEIGHVVQRHSIDQMQKHAGAGIGIAVLCSVTNACESALGQAALQIGGTYVLARYSRRDEIQADSEAVVNVLRAGYDPMGVPRLFERLLELREYDPGQLDGWFASHPLEESRIRETTALIQSIPAAGAEGLLIDTDDYAAFRARVAALPPSPEPRAPEAIVSPLP